MPELSPDAAFGTPGAGAAAVVLAEAGTKTRRHLGLGFWVPALWILLVVLVAVFAPVLPLKSAIKSDLNHIATSPGRGGHVLGTDEIGRDILARLVWGSRVSLIVGTVAVAVGLLVGGTVGLVAGYYRGRVEWLLMFLVDTMLAFPALVLVIALVAFLGQNLRNVTLAVAIVAIPAFARVTRGATLSFAQREFVTAARGMGATNRRIIFSEILPNVILPVAAFALVVVAVAIVAEGGLAFLGLSVPQPRPSWGEMISGGRDKLAGGTAVHVSLIPATVMFVTVLAFNLVGDRLRGFLDVREAAI
ncbi:MAG: ABC transporter permease [Actinobacteria bacterium]|nr:MAG: ABC transporter permease [Actinomycetota bacterium]